MIRTILALLIFSLTAISHAGELSELFVKIHPEPQIDFGDKNASPGARPFRMPTDKPKTTGITEIAMERSGCYGSCPIYTVVITSNGHIRYFGENYVRRRGAHTGSIPARKFQELAAFIQDVGFSALHDSYYVGVTDNPTVYTSVITEGKRKIVSNYANSGPQNLWAIEQIIDKLLGEAEWDSIKSKQTK